MITSHRSRPRISTPVEQRDNLDSWKNGVIDSKTADRIGKAGLRSSVNQILKQDGTLSDRPSTILYGVQPIGTVLGEIEEFTKRTIGLTNLTENYEISVQVVSGVASVYYRKDGGNWIQAVGKTFNATARCHFCPIRDVDADYNDQDKVLILNGKDNLSYLDINSLAIIPFVQLIPPPPATLSVGSAIVGSNFPQRYRVTAGNRGETAATVATAVTTQTPRSEWTGANQYIDVTIQRVTNAKRYHIYYGVQDGSEVYLASVDDPGSGTTVTWRDTGAVDTNNFRPAPAGDTTAGPIGTRAAFINGQVFIVGDKANPKYVRYGGTGLSVLDFSPYGGGGYEPIGGNKEVPVKVASFRKNDGSPAITVLCKGTNGFGKRYILSPQSIGNISYFSVEEENGNDGTEAPDSVILAKDQLWYLSRDGVKTTLTKAQVQTILSTEGVSDNIEKFISRLNTQSLEYSWGLTWENRLYWGVAVGSDKNNQIALLDLSNLRRGAWMLPWNIPADWGWLYNDNNGNTHFCILQNNKILEFTDSVATQDNGVPFPTSGNLGIQKFSPDGKEWGDMSQVTFVFNNLEGTVNCGVTGKTEDQPLAILGSETFVATSAPAGWGEREWGALAWGDTKVVPNTYSQERQEVVVEIGEELNWWEPSISTTNANCRYELLEVIPQYTNIGIKE